MNTSVFVPKRLQARLSNNNYQELTLCATCDFVPKIDSDITQCNGQNCVASILG